MNDDPTSLTAMFPEVDWDSPEALAQGEDFDAFEDMMQDLYDARIAAGITQAEVAKKMETKQSVISDLERLGGNPRIETVQRYARAIGMKLVLQAKPAKPATRRKSA